MFDKNVEKFTKYVEELDKKAKDAASNTEKKAKERHEKQKHIASLNETIERL